MDSVLQKPSDLPVGQSHNASRCEWMTVRKREARTINARCCYIVIASASEAIQGRTGSLSSALDCFVALLLAMTG
jgi:hypothetical protein